MHYIKFAETDMPLSEETVEKDDALDEYEAKLYRKGKIHGIVQVLVCWVILIALDIMFERTLGSMYSIYSVVFLNLLLIPVYLFCEKKSDSTRNGNYLGGYTVGSLIAGVLAVIIIFSPPFEKVIDNFYSFHANGYIFFFYAVSSIAGFFLTVIIRTVIKHIETKKRNQNEHRTA